MKRIVLVGAAAAASDTVAVDAINVQNKTSTFQTLFSFYTFYAVRMKVFYHIFFSLPLSVCVWITYTMCALVPNHTHRKPVDRKEEIRSVAILTLPSQLLYCDGIVKKCNTIQGIDAYSCNYI